MSPELRKDPLSGRWVIVAPHRAARPQDTDRENTRDAKSPCPFCAGNEALTPHEVLALESASPSDVARNVTPPWRVRVVPNKFPALIADPLNTISPQLGIDDEFRPGLGRHEVVIESPRHLRRTTELSIPELDDVLRVSSERLLDLRQDGRWRYGLVFKNVGVYAGASLEHLHSQIIALPIVPRSVMHEQHSADEFSRRHGRCYFCNLMDEETRHSERVAWQSTSFVAFCPFAARFPFETWILPRKHAARFEDQSDSERRELAEMLLRTLSGMERVLDKPAYNYAIRTTPFDSPTDNHYHWRMEIIPRLTKLAGFELSTDFYINVMRAEDAAAQLRHAVAQLSPT